METLSEDLLYFMKDKNIPKCAFIGHSLGGISGLRAVLKKWVLSHLGIDGNEKADFFSYWSELSSLKKIELNWSNSPRSSCGRNPGGSFRPRKYQNAFSRFVSSHRKVLTVVVSNATCLTGQIEAHEIHRDKGLEVRLSLALALSTIQVTVRFSSEKFPKGRYIFTMDGDTTYHHLHNFGMELKRMEVFSSLLHS
ncbi:hypothetical protein TNCV_4723271 [Trichonephila clavipes]|uniref:Uncharacterized protein n=1 Tax=Trichonephila clavipes TaxID=2585209 RepID=A0A8X6W6S0_TRICX|nr:hypothetical protein TNCV_4723271 [Trichonephila clavipes]